MNGSPHLAPWAFGAEIVVEAPNPYYRLTSTVSARPLYPNGPRGSAALRRAAPPTLGARPGWPRPNVRNRQPLAAIPKA
jgi:hypothetical protein